ncbi:MAG: PEP-utilizing enzyme [Gammaproteobacteria bacterium]|nr:PEP-utilizing enzyme [Gammaproteobacteria bacterium]
MRELIIPLSAPEATDANRFGPKAANLAALGQAGLPVPGGYCLDAEAYRLQLKSLGLEDSARAVFSAEDFEARRHALDVRLGLFDEPIDKSLRAPLLAAWRELMAAPDTLGVVRSSALVEDRFGSSFAGQFESFLGLENETEFLTAVRSCWCALWSTRALRYMATHDADPADTAMALIVQPLVHAQASGGGLSQTAEGEMLLSATWGLGSAIAQGEVVPDRYVLSRDGEVLDMTAGRKTHSVSCVHGTQSVDRELTEEPCLNHVQLSELGTLLRKTEDVIGGPTEIEWALDSDGIKLVQARPLHVEEPHVPDEIWDQRPRLRGHPAGIGWGTGRARVVNCECELSTVGPGDVLITKVAGPALSQILPHVSAVVAELGGSTSHLASLARERGIPMVLGVLDATRAIPDGSTVAVDGVAGIVRWIA